MVVFLLTNMRNCVVYLRDVTGHLRVYKTGFFDYTVVPKW